MSIAEARQERDKRKAQIYNGRPQEDLMTFGQLADMWLKKMSTSDAVETTLYTYKLRIRYLHSLASRPVAELKPDELVQVLMKLGETKPTDTVTRTSRLLKQILDFAVNLGKIQLNPAQNVSKALPVYQEQHFAAATTDADVGKLMRALEFVEPFICRAALKFIAYTFVRSGELREARWKEINFEKAEWIIPANHTKLRREHIVPLSHQALAILEDLRKRTRTATEAYIISSTRTSASLGKVTLMNALAALQLSLTKDVRPIKTTVHGFRSTASTLLHEAGFEHLVIERQLAHVPRDRVAAAYNRSEYLDKRREMMQWYADHLDKLRDNNK